MFFYKIAKVHRLLKMLIPDTNCTNTDFIGVKEAL